MFKYITDRNSKKYFINRIPLFFLLESHPKFLLQVHVYIFLKLSRCYHGSISNSTSRVYLCACSYQAFFFPIFHWSEDHFTFFRKVSKITALPPITVPLPIVIRDISQIRAVFILTPFSIFAPNALKYMFITTVGWKPFNELHP